MTENYIDAIELANMLGVPEEDIDALEHEYDNYRVAILNPYPGDDGCHNVLYTLGDDWLVIDTLDESLEKPLRFCTKDQRFHWETPTKSHVTKCIPNDAFEFDHGFLPREVIDEGD